MNAQARKIKSELKSLSVRSDEVLLQGFFKTGPGQYVRRHHLDRHAACRRQGRSDSQGGQLDASRRHPAMAISLAAFLATTTAPCLERCFATR